MTPLQGPGGALPPRPGSSLSRQAEALGPTASPKPALALPPVAAPTPPAGPSDQSLADPALAQLGPRSALDEGLALLDLEADAPFAGPLMDEAAVWAQSPTPPARGLAAFRRHGEAFGA